LVGSHHLITIMTFLTFLLETKFIGRTWCRSRTGRTPASSGAVLSDELPFHRPQEPHTFWLLYTPIRSVITDAQHRYEARQTPCLGQEQGRRRGAHPRSAGPHQVTSRSPPPPPPPRKLIPGGSLGN
jgi:hypothetical protein